MSAPAPTKHTSLPHAIEHLCRVFKTGDRWKSIEAIEVVDWTKWNEQAALRTVEYNDVLSFMMGLLPPGERTPAQIRFARDMLGEISERGGNIFLDTWEKNVLYEQPELLSAYIRAHERHGYRTLEGDTPLHWACELEFNAKGCIAACLKEGLDPNAPNHRGHRPLHVLWDTLDSWGAELDGRSLSRMSKGLQKLLKAGAHPYLQNEVGQSPWDLMKHACRWDFLSHSREGFEYLMQHLHAEYEAQALGRDTQAATVKGRTRVARL